jgi:hypothetical protein
MTWAGPSLSIFDLESGHCKRKKVGSCQGLFRRNNSLWVSSDASRFFFGQGNRIRVCAFDGCDYVLVRELTLTERFEPLLVIPVRSIALGADRISTKTRIETWSL